MLTYYLTFLGIVATSAGVLLIIIGLVAEAIRQDREDRAWEARVKMGELS